MFKFAAFTTSDVGRTCYTYEVLFANKRRKFEIRGPEIILVIYCIANYGNVVRKFKND
jgi:hypothetical protein